MVIQAIFAVDLVLMVACAVISMNIRDEIKPHLPASSRDGNLLSYLMVEYINEPTTPIAIRRKYYLQYVLMIPVVASATVAAYGANIVLTAFPLYALGYCIYVLVRYRMGSRTA